MALDRIINGAFESLTRGSHLSRADAKEVFQHIMSGRVPETTMAGLLGAMAAKGESVDELVGAAEAMRENAIPIRCDTDCIDTCGTGGDGISTFNVSTTAGIIASGAGATVAKHGNRSTTRVSGSTEVLTELGLDVNAEVAVVERSLAEARIGYLNARLLHPAMKYAAPVRQAIPVRTIFNLLGPLTNPAGAKRQILGVPHLDLVDTIAGALLELGTDHAWVVHGDDGLCDLTITSATTVVEVRGGELHRMRISPDDVGLQKAALESLRVESAHQSAAVLNRILQGEQGPKRDHAILNAGAALVVAGIAEDIREGVTLAGRAIDTGAARNTLARWLSIAGTDAKLRNEKDSG